MISGYLIGRTNDTTNLFGYNVITLYRALLFFSGKKTVQILTVLFEPLRPGLFAK